MNECLASPCNQECANIYGSYQCYCRQGYHLREDGHTCEGGAHSITHHKYHIYTKLMFRQVYESISHDLLPPFCSDIDECSQSIGHLCTYKCVNVPGSYQCACPEYGYTMSPNGRSCRGEHPSKKQNQQNAYTHCIVAASIHMHLIEFCSETDF